MINVVQDYTTIPFNCTWETHQSNATNQTRTSKWANYSCHQILFCFWWEVQTWFMFPTIRNILLF